MTSKCIKENPCQNFDAKNPLLTTLKSGNLTEKVIISEPFIVICFIWELKISSMSELIKQIDIDRCI